VNEFTCRQLRTLSLDFYEVSAGSFDSSRVDLAWPGWDRLLDQLPSGQHQVLDIGCGNGRFAAYLRASGVDFEYTGVDASQGLLTAARARQGAALGDAAHWIEQDFLDTDDPGDALPPGPYSLVVLMGVLHHVPSASARRKLLTAAAERLCAGGCLALTTWQFEGRPRFERRRVPWPAIGPVLGVPIDPEELEPGDTLLRFGADPTTPPRYCHQVADAEFTAWPDSLGLEVLDRFESDGAQGDLNRYWVLARR